MNGMYGDKATRVLLAVVEGAQSVREVAFATRLPVMTVHSVLVTLRFDGLVTWTAGKQRTLRAAVGVVDCLR